MKIGVNTYGLSSALSGESEQIWDELKTMGVSAIEPWFFFGSDDLQLKHSDWMEKTGFIFWKDAARRIVEIRSHGLKVQGGHFASTELLGEGRDLVAEQMVRLAKECGLKYYCLSLMVSAIQEAEKYIPALRYIAEKLAEEGIELLYHNHESELVDDSNDTVLAYFLREIPAMKLELDVGWVFYAGKDPVEIMRLYREKLRIIHFKDITSDACQENREHCFTAIGEGAIPLQEIIQEAEHLPQLYEIGYVIDQDRSETDILQDTKASVMNINAGMCVSRKIGVENCPFLLSVWSYPSLHERQQNSFFKLCQACVRNGIPYIDLMSIELHAYGMDAVKHIMTATGIKVNCYIVVLDVSSYIPEDIKKSMNKYFAEAKLLGTDKIMIIPYGITCSDEKEERAAADKIIKCLQIAEKEAARCDITVCVEDTPSCHIPLSSTEECHYILSKVPGLKLVFDTANMIAGGSVPLESYEKLKGYISHVHLKDVCYGEDGDECADGRKIVCVPWGQGIVPLNQLMQRMKADGCTKTAMIEYTEPENHSYMGHEEHLQRFLAMFDKWGGVTEPDTLT